MTTNPNELQIDRSFLTFEQNWQSIQNQLHDQVAGKGFWNHAVLRGFSKSGEATFAANPSIIYEKLALIHSEVSEAVEAARTGKAPGKNWYRESDGKPEGVPAELADAMIRIFDLAAYLEIDLWAAIVEKDRFNRTRPFMHGKTA